jgi:hypothetical protein
MSDLIADTPDTPDDVAAAFQAGLREGYAQTEAAFRAGERKGREAATARLLRLVARLTEANEAKAAALPRRPNSLDAVFTDHECRGVRTTLAAIAARISEQP